MDRPVVKELIQDELNLENLRRELTLLINDTPAHEKLRADYAELRAKLGGDGASRRAAASVMEFVKI
jgi:lipid-A-disaccharide synthase